MEHKHLDAQEEYNELFVSSEDAMEVFASL
jgi:hypothetical protein